MANRTYIKPVVEGLLRHFTPDEQSIPGDSRFGTSRIDEAVKHLNGAIQEISKMGPHWPGERGFAIAVNAPTDLTGVDITAGDNYISSMDAGIYADWMIGCTCLISGNDIENEILSYDPVTEILTFRAPVTTAVVGGTVTVYHDSLVCDDECSEVFRPVYVEDFGELLAIGGEGPSLYRANDTVFYEDYRYHQRLVPGSTGAFSLKRTEAPGLPAYYYIGTEYIFGYAYRLRIKITPVPNQALTVKYRGRLKTRHTTGDVTLFPKGPVSMVVVGGTATMTLNEDPTGAANMGIVSPDGSFGPTTAVIATTPGGNVVTFPVVAPIVDGTYSEVYYEIDGTPIYPPTLRFPDDLIESVLIPFAEQRLTASPYFRNNESRQEIYRQFVEARKILVAGNPQEQSPLRLRNSR